MQAAQQRQEECQAAMRGMEASLAAKDKELQTAQVMALCGMLDDERQQEYVVVSDPRKAIVPALHMHVVVHSGCRAALLSRQTLSYRG